MEECEALQVNCNVPEKMQQYIQPARKLDFHGIKIIRCYRLSNENKINEKKKKHYLSKRSTSLGKVT